MFLRWLHKSEKHTDFKKHLKKCIGNLYLKLMII